tara:strand:- start:26768 stop:27922 length:1155 start_codon:yes stop_codon:yes gene_type:complete
MKLTTKTLSTLTFASLATLVTSMSIQAQQCAESDRHIACVTPQGTLETQSKYPYDYKLLGHAYGETMELHEVHLPKGITPQKVGAGLSSTAFLGDDMQVYAYGGHFNSADRYGASAIPGHHYTDIEVCGGYIFPVGPEHMTSGDPRIHMWDINAHENHHPLNTTANIDVVSLECHAGNTLLITDSNDLVYAYDVNNRTLTLSELIPEPKIEFVDGYTIKGENFGIETAYISIDGINLEVSSWSAREIVINPIEFSISGNLVVTRKNGMASPLFYAELVGSNTDQQCDPETIEVIKEVEVIVTKTVEVPVEVIKEVLVEKVVEVPRNLTFEELLAVVSEKALQSKQYHKALRKALLNAKQKSKSNNRRGDGYGDKKHVHTGINQN